MLSKQSTVLVTGASGFVGRHLIAELEARTTWTLVGLGRHHVMVGTRTRVLACDLMDSALVRRVVDRHRPDAIIHLAAQSYVPQAFADPVATLTNNIVGQVHLLESCRACSIDPVILIVGSAEQYGIAYEDEMPVTEDQPFRPTNPYAVSKVAQDMLGLQYQLSFGMHILRVRPFNHFGPGQSDRFVMSSFARQVAQAELGLTEPIVLTGNLDARRDFLDVRDVVRAYRIALERAIEVGAYNIACGQGHRIGDLLERMIAAASIPLEIQIDPARMRPSDTPVMVGDATRFRAATGWVPEISVEATIRDTLAYWRQKLKTAERPGSSSDSAPYPRMD